MVLCCTLWYNQTMATSKAKPINIRITNKSRGLLAHLVQKYPLTEHALANRALELGLAHLVEDPRWLANGGDGETKSFITRDSLSSWSRRYHIHDNGGRPWQANMGYHGVTVYGFKEFLGGRTEYDVPVYETMDYQGYWEGFDTSGSSCHGNTLLVKHSDIEYTHIGPAIFTFQTDGVVLDYVSYLGNSNVPYPVAYTKDSVYFLAERMQVLRRDLKTRATLYTTQDLYSELYVSQPPRTEVPVNLHAGRDRT